MKWQVVSVKNKSTEKIPFINVGQDRLFFNEIACELIQDVGQYKYVQFLKGEEDGKEVIAAKFLCFYDENAIDIVRETQNGRSTGITINNKDMIDELFGDTLTAENIVQYKVELYGNDMLIINK